MGLPLWRDPDERRSNVITVAKPPDATAAARSSIRRRPSVHGNRNSSRRYARYFVSPPRDVSELRPSPVESVPPARRTDHRHVPSITNLLELADPATAQPSNRNIAHSSARSDDRNPPSNDSNIDLLMERLAHRVSRSGNGATERDRPARHDNRRDWTDATPHQPGVFWEPSTDPQAPRIHVRSRYNTLPTPPYEPSSEDLDTENMYNGDSTTSRRSHPLSNSWRPDSPMGGLGDRNRSPTPADGWEIMRSTITPDENLPSVHSSFASTAASRSFTTSNGTALADMDSQSNSIATVVPDDLACLEDATSDNEISGALADRVYQHEMRSQDGFRRIRQLRSRRSLDGNRFALAHEPEHIDIGFRLIEEHLETADGRALLTQLGVINSEQEMQRRFSLVWSSGRFPGPSISESSRRSQRERPQPRAHMLDALRVQQLERERTRAPSGNANALSGSTSPASVNVEARHHTSSLRLAPMSQDTSPSTASSNERSPDGNFARDDATNPSAGTTSTDEGERGQLERLLRSESTNELDELRRLWPRLSRRDDVPDDWWSRIGLLLSRTRPGGRDSLLLDEVSSTSTTRHPEGRSSPRL